MTELESAKAVLAEAGRIVTFSGAGLSAESGIATFREPQTGLWAKHDPTRLASPDGFSNDPDLVIRWYNERRRKLSESQPNAAHRALAARHDLTHIAQNVDNLLEQAGAEQVLHLHGRIDTDRCHNSCGFEETINLADPPPLRNCPRCGSPVRPAVVWFGESLSEVVWSESIEAMRSADVVIVIGTSGVVFPAAGLVNHARTSGAAIIVVNTEPTASSADFTLVGSAADFVPKLLTA